MKLDILLLLSTIFLALVIFCHALEDVDKPDAHSTNIEGHYATAKAYLKANTKLGILILFSSAFSALVAYILHYKADNSKPEANDTNSEDHYVTVEAHLKEDKLSKLIATHKIRADAYVSDAIAFLQKHDAANAIEAYKRAAAVYNQITTTALMGNLLTEAIEAYKREIQMYKQAAHLCRKTNNVESEASFHACVADAHTRMTEICEQLADECSGENDCISKALTRLKVAVAFREPANSFRSAGDMSNAIAMYTLAAQAFTFAAKFFHAAKSFNQEAKAWMQTAEARALCASSYIQMGDTLNGATMYKRASDACTSATYAYRKVENDNGIIEARQQTVAWLTIAAQMYHDAGDHKHEVDEYSAIAHLHVTLNEQAKAGAAFELAGQAYLHAEDRYMAITMFEEAEQAYNVIKDRTALRKVQSIIATLSS